MATHYDTLGVKRGCSPGEIRSAYRKLVLDHHPDRSKSPESRDIFIRATEAYEVLSDQERRRDYDRILFLEDQKQMERAAARQTPKAQPKPRAEPKRVELVAVELTKLVQLFSRGRMFEAETLAKDLMTRAPREAIPYGVLADICRSRGELAEAAKLYAIAAQMDPRNQIYQRRHEELIGAIEATTHTIHVARARQANPAPLIAALIATFLAGIYLAASHESPLWPKTPTISGFTLGSLGVLFFSGVVAGISLAIGGWLDTYESTAMSATGKRSPAAALGFLAVANFWISALLYLLIGLGQRGFNYSTSRMVGATAFLTLLFAGCALASEVLSAGQILAWGGNLIYLGSLVGWMVADAFR